MWHPKDGGPAFGGRRDEMISQAEGEPPTPVEVAYPGMSMLDYFAARALAGLTACEAGYSPRHVAERAYRYAESMIEERNRRHGK